MEEKLEDIIAVKAANNCTYNSTQAFTNSSTEHKMFQTYSQLADQFNVASFEPNSTSAVHSVTKSACNNYV